MTNQRCRHWLLSGFLMAVVAVCPDALAQGVARFQVEKSQGARFTIIAPAQFRWRSGLGLPMTHRFVVAPAVPGLVVRKRTSSGEAWHEIPARLRGGELQSGEIARYDRAGSQVYVSAAFGAGDSLFLELAGTAGEAVNAIYAGITKYYDNRRAAVTVTADDWLEEFAGQFPPLLDLFRSYDLPVTLGITTSDLSPASWSTIQKYVDNGSIEVASHSRTHPLVPYADPVGEVIGSRDDILRHLRLPGRVSAVNSGSLPVWLAPSGDYDDTIDSLLTVAGYLVPRLYLNLPVTPRREYTYGEGGFSPWDSGRQHYAPFYPTVELGAPEWGGGDTSLSSLNALFEATVAAGGVYHPMWHPQVLTPDRAKPYLLKHLAHISRRQDLWYAGLGPLYLYHLVQEANAGAATVVRVTDGDHLPGRLAILPPVKGQPGGEETIRMEVPKKTFVNLSLYDTTSTALGTLINSTLGGGVYEVHFERKVLSGQGWVAVFTAGDTVAVKARARSARSQNSEF